MVALVTGAGSGIGRATCRRLADEGVAVVAFDLNEEGLSQTLEELSGEKLAVPGDVTSEHDVGAAVQLAVETFGGLDWAVNAAGVLQPLIPLLEVSDEIADRVMNVNVKGVLNCLRYQIPAMLARGGGGIVNISSVAGLRGATGMSIYAASKHAVMGLTRSAALEYGKAGIRINAVCPGLIDTPMMDVATPEKREKAISRQPSGRLGTPSEVADAIYWLLSSATYCSGSTLIIDGGLCA